jgi:TP901-1 family phage major tail protein
MAKFLGNALLLKIASTSGGSSYGTIGGSSEHSFNLNNEQVDVSDKDSNRWKELLAAGDRSLSISMSGFISDDSNYVLLESAYENDTIWNMQLAYGDSKTITGAFHIDSFEVSGARNDGQSFSATITNSGEPTFA